MTNYALNDEKMFADITDGIAVIINSETGIYFGMNAFATIVYENIANGVCTEKIYDFIKKLPNVPDTFEDNFNMFVDAMIEKEILLPVEASDINPDIDLKVANEDLFVLELREYNDAQELLLADPIHEVKEETGWAPEKSSINTDKNDIERREAKTRV